MAAYAPPPPVQAPEDRRRRRRRGNRRPALIGVAAAAAAVVIAAAVVVVVVLTGRSPSGPDPYEGSYPLVGVSASPGITWQASGPPAGPLKRFSGRRSQIVGKVVDRRLGLAYARLGAPWKPVTGFGAVGIEWTVQKPAFHFWAGAYSDPLDGGFLTAAKGPNGLRAAAELDARQWAKEHNGTPSPIAGQPLKVSGRNAWLAGYRVRTPDSHDGIPERALVVVVVNTGRAVPAVFEVSVARPKYLLLPDINTLVGSLQVIR